MRVTHLISLGSHSHSDFVLFIAPGGGLGAELQPKNLDDAPLRIAPESAKRHVDDDRWIHLVLTYDGRRLRLYVDGREDKVKYLPGGLDLSQATLNVGRVGKGEWRYGFKGRLDDLILWNRALTEVEVRGLWATLNEF
jgi:hypothetical protein